MIKRATTTTLFFFHDMIHETSISPTIPQPSLRPISFSVDAYLFLWQFECIPCLFSHFGLGQVLEHDRLIIFVPLLFSAPASTHLVLYRSKSKAKQNTKKSKASEHNRLNCDFRSLIHFVLSFPFFASIFSILSPENMQKPMESVMGEQKLP